MSRSSILAAFFLAVCSNFAPAETTPIEPLVTKSKIEAVATKCNAKVAISDVPAYNGETNPARERATMIVEIHRSNSLDAIACMRDAVPSVVTMLVGQEAGLLALDQAQLDKILRQCKWRKRDGFVGFVAGGELHFQPRPNANFKRVDCVLGGMNRYGPKMGFIGNEAFAPEEEKR